MREGKCAGNGARNRGSVERYLSFCIKHLAWLCWQSEANPSLPAHKRNAGRFRQIAGKAPTYSCRKPQTLNALDSSLPNLTSRENLFHSREASRADEVFGTFNRQRTTISVAHFCRRTATDRPRHGQCMIEINDDLNKSAHVDGRSPDVPRHAASGAR